MGGPSRPVPFLSEDSRSALSSRGDASPSLRINEQWSCSLFIVESFKPWGVAHGSGFHPPGGPEPLAAIFHLLGVSAYFPNPIILWTRPALLRRPLVQSAMAHERPQETPQGLEWLGGFGTKMCSNLISSAPDGDRLRSGACSPC